MKQQTLTGFEKYAKTTQRSQFLMDMGRIIHCPELAAAVQTVYPQSSENDGRPPIPLERLERNRLGKTCKIKLIHTIVASAANVAESDAPGVGLSGADGRQSRTRSQGRHF